MNLRYLDDEQLHLQTKSLASSERELLTKVLHHLREIDRRRLYSELKYKSIFEYAVKELGYSEDQAYRRIEAMRLLRDLPQVGKMITSGELTLSSLNVATNAFRANVKVKGERLQDSKKLEVLKALENKSRRQAEQIVQNMIDLPKEALRPEKIRVVDEVVEIRLVARKSLEQKIDRIKGWVSHKYPNISIAELFELLCDEYLARQSKKTGVDFGAIAVARKVEARQSAEAEIRSGGWPQTDAGADRTCLDPVQKEDRAHEVNALAGGVSEIGKGGQPALGHPVKEAVESPSNSNRNSRARIPVSVRRDVIQKAKGRCTRCGSTRFLELDHIIPISLGGSDQRENLRLLCRPCNQRAAVGSLGLSKMDRFLNSRPNSKS